MIQVPDIDSKEKALNAGEAGALFGITGDAMYKRAKRGMAPFHKLGRKVYFFESELIGHIRQI